MNCERTKLWLQVLIALDGLNRRVKEPGWNYEDKQEVYKLKDAVLAKIMTDQPQELKVTCYYVPYYMYSTRTKDRAGALMRSDTERNPFEYYLSLVEPCADDIEVPSKATVEVAVTCEEYSFSFHQPISWYQALGGKTDALQKKPWISAINFHHAVAAEQSEKIRALLRTLEA